MSFLRGLSILEFLRTDRGRSALFIASGLTGCAVYVAVSAPHTWALKKLKDTMQMYKDGYPVKLSAYVTDLAAQTLTDCGITEREANHLKWFTAFGFEPIHKGQISMRTGAIIGLPKTFFYNSADEVDRGIIKMHYDNSVPWKTEAGEALLSSLVFSEDARKFAIAREVSSCRTQHVLVKSVCLGAIIPLFTTFGAYISERFGIHRYPRRTRAGFYGVIGLIGLMTALVFWDVTIKFYEHDSDVTVAEMGEKYLEGGVEYYSKQLLTNRALRELLGAEGKRTYTAEGEVAFSLRQPHVALKERRDFFEAKLKEFRSKKVEEDTKKTAAPAQEPSV